MFNFLNVTFLENENLNTKNQFNTMKLTLKNFRCYSERTFDFGEKGLLLLSGHSGVGKTSIILAINFAL